MTRRLLIAVLMMTALLTACGGSEEQGIELQVAAPQAAATPAAPDIAPGDSPTATGPEATGANAGETASPAEGMTGRLLIRRGQVFELFDLATGDILPFEDLSLAAGGTPVNVGSPVGFNVDGTRGVFVAFPDFGVLDVTTRQVSRLRNTGSFPNALQLSPDGQWLAALTGGGFVTRLQLIATDDSQRFDIAASSQNQFQFYFTPDSEFIWAEIPPDDAPRVYRLDRATGTSTPLDNPADPTIEVITYADFQVSPNGTRLAQLPRAPGLEIAAQIAENTGTPQAELCFDSYITLVDLPVTLAEPFPEGRPIYTAPGLVASSAQWLADSRLLFVLLGEGVCGDVQGEESRMIALLDLTEPEPRPVTVAGPLGNANDPSDFAQNQGRAQFHLFSPSPDGRFVAWIAGGPDADETIINVTEIATGATQTVRRLARADTADAVEYMERTVFRQVVWLE